MALKLLVGRQRSFLGYRSEKLTPGRRGEAAANDDVPIRKMVKGMVAFIFNDIIEVGTV